MKYNEKKRLQIALRRFYSTNVNTKEISELLGINKKEFISYIDSQLLVGMDKNNFGKVWGLDHIVPVELFDISNVEDKKICYNYQNIIPMFNDDNRVKGASVHFSLIKLNTIHTNVYIEKLKEVCLNEIKNRYEKYLLI